MDVWVITLINENMDVMEDAVTYDESAVADIADELRSIRKPTEQVVISHATAVLPWEMES